jgi:hypothetical protein
VDQAAFKEVVIEFIINVFDRISRAAPQLKFKELALGLACSKNNLLIGEMPQGQEL